jgi:GNAT superfamily N-acetyltransferase
VITTVTEADLAELLPLMRGYCDFYEVAPSDEALLALSRNLIEHPAEGVQLIARDGDGTAVGFATIFWTWQTLSASRLGVMNDLFVSEAARGGGHADALIAECLARCREHGATDLAWQTARTNLRAQGVYDRVGATRDDRWLDYSVTAEPGATTPDS